jgi:hypothetical protein
MRNDLPISPKKKFKYYISFESWDEESLEVGQTDNRGIEVEDSIDTIGEILYEANTKYGIYYPLSFGGWESTEPEEDRDFWEKGIRKYYALHITNEDGTEISQEESNFISFLLSDGRYEIDKFRDFAVGGVVIGSIVLGVGALITYFYFKGKKGGKGKKELVGKTSKSVTYKINGKDRKFPIKDAWKREHSLENKSEDYEVAQADRFEMGGDASEHYHEIEYGEGGVARAKEVIINKIGLNEQNADFLTSQSEKFAIWLADAIIKANMTIVEGTTKKQAIDRLNNSPNILQSLRQRIRFILDWLQHPVTPKQNLRELSFAEAEAKAREWHNELQVLGGDIDFTEPEKNTILKKYPKNSEGIEYYWVFIPSNYCDLESSRMGHCGRTGYGNNLISLRSVKPYGKGHTINDSHITIAYGVNDGMFYQVKGKKNNKPAEKYFPYIFDLIKTFITDDATSINSVSDVVFDFSGFGSEYGQSEDYGYEDMTNNEVKELYQLKPSLFDDADGYLMLFDNGIIVVDELKKIVEENPETFQSPKYQLNLYNLGIVDTKPSFVFELSEDCSGVADLLNVSNNFRDDLIENILCGDTNELSDNWSYYYENPSDLVNNLNKENEQKVIDEIVRITGLDESVVKENGIEYYLNGDDEDFSQDAFDNIIRVLASAQNNADNEDYYNYLYKELKNSLEELGEVNSLNDEGVKMSIDLTNFNFTEEELVELMEDYEFSDISDLFYELKSRGDLDLPSFSIDDRYSPYGSSEDFNSYVSDSDLEAGYEKGGSLRTKNKTKNQKNKIKNMKPSQRKLAQGGSIDSIGISKEDYYLVVNNWVYFTFNYPMGFVKDTFSSSHLSKHLEEKFSSSYTRYGSVGVLMSFWANLDNENREILSLWIKNNYFNGDKTKLMSISDDDYANIITHWNKFCFNFPYGFIEKVFGDNTSHFEMKWVRAYESAGSTGAVNKFFTELSSNNQELLTNWVYDNYKGVTFADGGLVVKNDSDLQEVAKYMTNAVKKHRWDLKDLIHYFEQENNFDYQKRVEIWEDMNGYEMPKTYNNIYEMLKRISEANGQKYEGGGEAELNYSDILNVLKSKIDDSIDDIPNSYENSSSFTGEEIEHEFRDGFIPYTDGGYEARWFEMLDMMYGTGYGMPTKPLDDEMNRQIEYNLKLAKDNFIENYPEIVEELGVENIDYNSLYEAGYGEEAEELSSDETEMMAEDTIMMRIMANYYNPENSRAKDGKHTIRLFGDVNLESPYHRTGNLDDSYEYEFTFNSISELESEMDKGIEKIISWFNGNMYNDSTAEMKVRRMEEGGDANDDYDDNDDDDDDEYAGGGELDDFIKREGIVREHLFFLVDKNGNRLQDWAKSGDNVLRYQQDWEGEEWIDYDDLVTESILKRNGVNPNNINGVVVYDLSKGEQIFNGSQLSDEEWYDYVQLLKKETYGEYAEGGEVEDWMEEALNSLMEETGSTDLEISYVSDNGNSFYATDNKLEYRVFKTEDDAEEVAVEQVREDLEENPEYFNQEWLMNYIDGRNFFEESLNEMNLVYAEDIKSENDKVYANRLIAEMVENGIMDEEDALSGNAEELADYYMQDFVNLMTEEQLNEGNDGLDYFISNFGEEETYRMVRDNNLIDIDEASKDAVNVDGIGHFLSSYDGETLYLSDDYVAYRIN